MHKLKVLVSMALILASSTVLANGNVDRAAHNQVRTLIQQDNLDASDGGNLTVGLQDALVNAHGICRWLDNGHTDNDYFVPTKTQKEWEAFIDGAHPGVTIALCCPSQNVTLQSTMDAAQSQSFSLQTGRDGVAPDPLGYQKFEATFTVVGGIEKVTEEYRCVGTTWQKTAYPSEFTPTVCNNTTECSGFTFITRDCNGTILNSEADSPSCGYVPPACANTSGCEGFNYVTRNCFGAVVGNDINSATCGYVAPAGPPVCNDVAQSSSYPCGAGFTGNVITHWNQNTCTGAWSGYWEDTSGCTPVACNNTSSCEGFNYVTRNCNGGIVAQTQNSPSCGYVPPQSCHMAVTQIFRTDVGPCNYHFPPYDCSPGDTDIQDLWNCTVIAKCTCS